MYNVKQQIHMRISAHLLFGCYSCWSVPTIPSCIDIGFSRAFIVLLLCKNPHVHDLNFQILWPSLLDTVGKPGAGWRWDFTTIDLLLCLVLPLSNSGFPGCQASLSPTCSLSFTTSFVLHVSNNFWSGRLFIMLPLCNKVGSTADYAGLLLTWLYSDGSTLMPFIYNRILFGFCLWFCHQ